MIRNSIPQIGVGTLVLLGCAAGRAHGLRVVTYNILNYSGDSTREAHYRSVLSAIQPDLVVVQEILSQAAVDRFRDQVLNHADGPAGTFAAASFVNGPDTDNALFYRTDLLSFTAGDHLVIPTSLRNIDRWKLRPAGYSSGSADLYVYSVHLKASQGGDNEQRRLDEVTQMRNNADLLAPGTNFIALGDTNIYTSSEPAYQKMITPGSDADGQLFDPIDMPGSWHNDPAFAAIHTQSPRTAQFGGGANGGMDDRFDMILQSAALDDDQQMSYVPGTYSAFGQDGSHFNLAIIDSPTIPEGSVMADALHQAADHLPVLMDLQVPARIGASSSLDFGTVIVGASAAQALAVSNVADLVRFTFVDVLDYSLSPAAEFDAPPGQFEAVAGAPANQHMIIMQTGTRGVRSGDLDIFSDDVGVPVLSVPLSGTVLSHARPSASGAVEVLEETLDFGVHAPGEFPSLAAEIHNFAFDALQAELEVYDATVVGSDAARFSIQGGFAPAVVGDSSAQFTVQVGPDLDDVAAGQTLTADLVFLTRDDPALSGAASLADVTFHLIAQTAASGLVGDLNLDGRVDLLDFATMANCFGLLVTTPTPSCPVDSAEAADLDGNGVINLLDFATFANHFTG